MACFYLETCQYEKAFMNTNAVLEVDPSFAEGWSFIGHLYLIKRDLIRAEFYINKSLSIIDNYSAHITMGHLRYLKGDEDFLRSYITAYLLDEDHFEYFDAVRRELIQLLDSKEAKQVFDMIKKAINADAYKSQRLTTRKTTK